MSAPRGTTYWDYIKVEELLALQGGLEGDEATLQDEELLFITVHQVFELWFKLVRHELLAARNLFVRDRVSEQELSRAAARLRRVTTIFRTGAQHFEVVETLGTREYLAFRNKLMPASGFQSAQLRQIEILFGLEDDERIPLGAPGSHITSLHNPDGSASPALARVQEAQADRPNLREAVDAWLERTPIDGVAHDHPDIDAVRETFVQRFLDAERVEIDRARAHAKTVAAPEDHARLDALYDRQAAATAEFLRASDHDGDARHARVRIAMLFIETYRELPLLSWPREILAGLIEVEQAFLIFRQRHARMVERVIGRRVGTGGSAGVEYLDRTALEYRVFRDLWATRTLLLKGEAAPPLERAGYYDFAQGDLAEG